MGPGRVVSHLLLAAQPAAPARLAEFPDFFVATWGGPGPDCAQWPGRVAITRSTIRYGQLVAGVADATRLAHNRLRIRFRQSARRARIPMTLTVGTTGSRLFIERRGRKVVILTHCGH